MRALEKIGRFSICENRKALYLRWWDTHGKKTASEKLDATTLAEARKIVNGGDKADHSAAQVPAMGPALSGMTRALSG
jgi:hypothetical protein